MATETEIMVTAAANFPAGESLKVCFFIFTSPFWGDISWYE
ncbi:hypothetical protein YPPY13_4257 [Yersinia pestis PY-13]|nr:hypothetical protein YPPY13_4257 [Yersinia pestis PY-13]EIR99896.1 hypothetical protein YPPY46_4196 [Yersinia pestis PY-46]EIS86292.1 hypothetical protein YPPY88_4284 [Yersinia pestis PY-88]EIT10477.1 hypothetical protein YPPY92_4266 [Yersinia pestis PY-92]